MALPPPRLIRGDCIPLAETGALSAEDVGVGGVCLQGARKAEKIRRNTKGSRQTEEENYRGEPMTPCSR